MSDADPTAARPSVLLVDDEPALLEAMRLNLESIYDVHTATSVDEAEMLLALQRCDVIVTDHLMPHELGLNFLLRVKDRYPKMRRILVTGYMNPELLSRATQVAGLSACLLKPVRHVEIVREINRALATEPEPTA